MTRACVLYLHKEMCGCHAVSVAPLRTRLNQQLLSTWCNPRVELRHWNTLRQTGRASGCSQCRRPRSRCCSWCSRPRRPRPAGSPAKRTWLSHLPPRSPPPRTYPRTLHITPAMRAHVGSFKSGMCRSIFAPERALQGTLDMHYMRVCVYVCVCARVCACVCHA